MREETLRMERVTYREQGVTQLENFSMSIWAGEIMGLMPVNRHGISALIKLLRQNLPLHYGYVNYLVVLDDISSFLSDMELISFRTKAVGRRG